MRYSLGTSSHSIPDSQHARGNSATIQKVVQVAQSAELAEDIHDTLLKCLRTVEGLPTELAKQLSELRSLDEQLNGSLELLRRVMEDPDHYRGDLDPALLPRLILELAERKSKSGIHAYDLIDEHILKLDSELNTVEIELRKHYAKVPANAPVNSDYAKERSSTESIWSLSNYGQIRAFLSTAETGTGAKALKSVANKATPRLKGSSSGRRSKRAVSPSSSTVGDMDTARQQSLEAQHSGANSSEVEVEYPFDPNEPTYCSCHKPSFGSMIKCDNDDCMVEWYHFECVGLNVQPKGKWFCPSCAPLMATPAAAQGVANSHPRKRRKYHHR